jgi:DNA-binding response OmpR family regulator
MTILIVEDQPRVAHFVEKALSEHGFESRLADTCAGARRALAESTVRAVVLDLGLPDGDGIELLREWREAGLEFPVLILSARDAITDRIKGLNIGADDYLSKPFSVDELVARVRSLLRRNSGSRATVLTHGTLRLDVVSRSVARSGARIELTGREFALLELFLRNPGKTLTQTFIAEQIWGAKYGIETNLIDVYVRRLREKLEEGQKPLFRTVRGTGYVLL